MMIGPMMMSLVMKTLVTRTLEMGRRKTKLRTRSKTATLERASSQDVDEVGDQEAHEVSTQDVQAAVHVTRGPSKYLDIWDLPDEEEIELPLNSMHQPVDDGARTFTGFLGTIARKPHMCPIRFLNWKAMPEEFKEECWRLVKRKYSVPADPVAYAALKTFTLQKIGKAWRDHKSRLKKQHYIPDSRNKARVKNKDNTGCIKQDWEILVDHWYTDDAVIESEKNKARRSKQDDLHTASSCAFAVHAAKKAKMDGLPVERAVLYPILHTRKNGSAVNSVVKEKMEKMKLLLDDSSNQLQSSDMSGSIAWSTNDVFAQVMGKERKGRIRGVGFGPSPSGQSSKSARTDIEIQSSQARDNEVAQLKASLATMEDKLASFDEMKERLSQFEDMEQRMEERMARMLQQMQQSSSQCNQDVPSAQQSPALQKSSAASYQPSSL
ncbi:uncharacterized protein LOC112018425 [Quercus suber]|uniref:uncharacterized protein LOC112018425 n=1 Tax=Quercus suber TaxID=58331 RepID=UPI0032DF51D8